MEKILDARFMGMIQQLPLNLQLTVKNSQMGARRSTAKGSSVEFSDYRTYMPGDDFRRIDWNALARFEKVFIKLFMEEQEAPVSVLLDTSHSMDYYGKKGAAVKTAAAFIYTALSAYDSVTAATFNDGIRLIRKGVRGTKGFWQLADMMEQSVFEGDSHLEKAVVGCASGMKKGITVLITDLMYPCDLERVLSQLRYRKQKVILCQVLGREEIAPLLLENQRFIDSESGAGIDIDAGPEAAALYSEKYHEFINEIRKQCDRFRVHHFIINASEGIEVFLHRLIKELN